MAGRLGQSFRLGFQLIENGSRIETFGIVSHCLQPFLAKSGQALFSQVPLVRPIAESVADNFAV